MNREVPKSNIGKLTRVLGSRIFNIIFFILIILIPFRCSFSTKNSKNMINVIKENIFESKPPSKEDSIRLKNFLNLLISEGYYDESCLKKLKEYALIEHEKYDGMLCSDISVLEYHTSYENFLPYLKNGNEFDLKQNFKLGPIEYLNTMYQNTFAYLKLKSIIKNFRIENDTTFSVINGQNVKNIIHKVKFENNGVEYQDNYSNMADKLKEYGQILDENSQLNIRNFDAVLISNKSINYLLTDINSSRRLIVSRLGKTMKTFSMDIETGKFFDSDICFADTYVNIESVLDKFSKNNFIDNLSIQAKREIIKNYRFDHPSILLPTILVYANTSRVKEFKIFNFGENKGNNWAYLVEVLTNGEIKLANFKDNLDEYKTILNQLNKGENIHSFTYKFEYRFNGELIKKELLISKEDRFKILEKKVFNLVFVELNSHLKNSGNQRQFYYDGYYLYFLNKEEKDFIKSEGLIFDLLDKF